ncbi:hypothetical protein HGRIS_001727 [Hohenbuehelia grisea]|uniref:Uncharacterized protein n=1 Tax=Hohenbuehelia grisea TaxID=104357 RepID=A0ABR3JJA0_9AGAR
MLKGTITSFIAFLALATPSAAVQFATPQNPIAGTKANITWTAGPQDFPFDIFLMGTDAFDLKGILGRSVDPALQTLEITWPNKGTNLYSIHLSARDPSWVDRTIGDSGFFNLLTA